jgi:hypothetical protein
VSELGEKVEVALERRVGSAPDASCAALIRAAGDALADFPKPTVALVQGAWVGGRLQAAGRKSAGQLVAQRRGTSLWPRTVGRRSGRAHRRMK